MHEEPSWETDPPGSDIYVLRLFIAGPSPLSRRAIVNTRRICETHLPGRYTLEILDLCQNPELAGPHQIIGAPTLVKESPPPVRRFVGDMSRTVVILHGLGLTDASGTQILSEP